MNEQDIEKLIPKPEDVSLIIIDYLRKRLELVDSSRREITTSDYGYDLYVQKMILDYFNEKANLHFSNIPQEILDKASIVFMDSCWNLCRRGILRPDTKTISGQGNSQGAGYSITEFGKQWLSEADKDDFVPTEPSRFAGMLGQYKQYFVPAFQQRAQEAVRCYEAHAYLACLVMCGAAAEAILHSVVKKLKIKETSTYKIEQTISKIVEHSSKVKNKDINKYTDLLKYWRDEGMHGEVQEASDNEAFTSLALLLRFAMFAQDKWFGEDKPEGKNV